MTITTLKRRHFTSIIDACIVGSQLRDPFASAVRKVARERQNFLAGKTAHNGWACPLSQTNLTSSIQKDQRPNPWQFGFAFDLAMYGYAGYMPGNPRPEYIYIRVKE